MRSGNFHLRGKAFRYLKKQRFIGVKDNAGLHLFERLGAIVNAFIFFKALRNSAAKT